MPQYAIAPRDLLFAVAQDLVVKGWQPVWCLQRQSGGFSPMEGLTGYDAPFPTVVPQPAGSHRLGFRPPPSLVIIDVDHYDGKRGADIMDAAEEWLGELPLTFKVTSRGLDNPSGRFIYRKPEDLDFSDSALAQFGNVSPGKAVEILRTGHRFSWAPGDVNHKNGLQVQCFDPWGEPCLLPDVNSADIPSLPERWVNYLRQPPAPSLSGYSRPDDGPQWWLSQPDSSLATDDELKSFAFSMMLSRVPLEEVFEQWVRVSRADDPSWPWSREDFDRHTRSQAQGKAAQQIAREDAEEAMFEGIAGGPDGVAEITRQAAEQFDRERKLVALREQRIAEVVQGQQLFHVQPLEEDAPRVQHQSDADYLSGLVRGTPEYDRQFKNSLARRQAERDVEFLLAAQFKGYRSIAYLPEPPEPETLKIVGKDSKYSAVIARGKVTVISGHRSSGKTWVTAAWAAQELRAGNKVIWLDFERQDDQLGSKVRQLGVPVNVIDAQLRYSSELPPAALLIRDVEEAAEGGAHRVLLVVDAFRALQSRVVPGSNANDGDAVEQVYADYLTPVAEAGANVVLLDHLPKDKDKGTFGSERKESAADYVILVSKTQKFSRGTAGFSTLTLTKARGGHHDEDTPVGYLWMPGNGSSSADEGIRQYPRHPELRNWPPEAEGAALDALEGNERGARNEALVAMVAEDRLRHSINSLCKAAMEAYPEVFKSEASTKRWIRELVAEGKLSREGAANGKLDLPSPVKEVHKPAPAIRPEDLEHPEAVQR